MRAKKLAIAVGASASLVLTAAVYAPPCPWDLDNDGAVGVVDFLDLLSQWGPGPGKSADFDHDQDVDAVDFLELLANWGPCP